MGKLLAESLRTAGAKAETHDDHFPADAPDEQWLDHAGKAGWIVLTKDKAIRRRPNERQALLASKVSAFVFTAGDISGDDMRKIIVNNLGKIAGLAVRTKPPFIAKITRSGDVALYEKKES